LDKNKLSETDICEKFISPALVASGWDIHEQILREYPLRPGRMVVRGQKAARDKKSVLRADYVLFWKANIPLAVIEAKDNAQAVGAGMAQAIDYGALLEVPFVFSSNGDGFVFRDATLATGTLETSLGLDAFPTPAELWSRLCAHRGWTPEVQAVADQPYAPSKTPRYYQLVAVNRTVEAIARGQNRVLLVMATGTGKTYTAFQIIHRLWKSSWKADKPSGQKRILFLADRNILIDQTMVNDFRPFKGAMAKLSPNAKGIERIDAAGKTLVDELDLAVNRTTKQVDKSYEIYLSLYQAVSGTEEAQNIYKQFSPDFFDLIVVDECHRGSADEDSAWREILTYFQSAAHIGLTATPKETKDVSNTEYFGEPIYTYSLRQGIEDGYLAPYKVIRVDIDKDVFGWRPPAGMLDKHGNVIEDRIYNATDMNRSLVLEKRDELVAARITEYLKATDRYAKTIVFCEDIDHASRMRQALANANADIAAAQPNYVVQITGDNADGKAQLDNFIDPEKRYPVIATTSKLLSTGVDAQTCKLIVLDQNIKSMTLFKQIIGRGTRLREDLGKTWFTILDFKRATDNFADPAFDGDPVQVYEPRAGDPVTPPDDSSGEVLLPDGSYAPHEALPTPFAQESDVHRYVVGQQVQVSVARERVQYLNAQGQLITESLRDYTRINLAKRFASIDEFLQTWNAADKKAALVEELESEGVLLEALADEVGRELDPFDLVLHVAYNQPTLTRRERAQRVKKRHVFAKYGDTARRVIEALIDKYADEGLATLESMDVLKVPPLNTLGSPVELVRAFGGRAQYDAALHTLERELYARDLN
jgi:type I restriction enzyme, R subunit